MNTFHTEARSGSSSTDKVTRGYFPLFTTATIMIAALLVPGPASADSISGIFSVGFGEVGITLAGGTNFYAFDTGSNTPPGGTAGQCDVPGSSSGCFQLETGTGTFQNLVGDPSAANSIANIAPTIGTQAFPRVAEISLDGGSTAGGPGVSFDLESISVSPSVPACTGVGDVICTIYLGSAPSDATPYELNNSVPNSTSVQAVMYFYGYTNGNTTNEVLYQGIFTTQLSGINIDGCGGIFDTLAGSTNCGPGGTPTSPGTETSTWGASFSPVSATPEPGTSLLAGLGFLAVAYGLRKRKRITDR